MLVQYFSSFGNWLGRLNIRHTTLALALSAVVILKLTGITAAVDRSGDALRSSLFSTSASSNFVVVEMDAKSLKEIGQWPWSRTVHADLVDRLSSHGAAQIAFDIDFSSKSNPQADKVFAEAIANSSSNVILATFKQGTTDGSDVFSENLPRPELAANAMLASVNVVPNELGQISSYDYAEKTGGETRPSLAAMLMGTSGNIGSSFEIDPAIDPSTIPRLSVVDVLEGRVAPEDIAGKSMIIGATAIELGDRYATPFHNVIPGVVIHALAAETLAADMDVGVMNGAVPLLLTVILVVALSHMFGDRKKRTPFRASILLVIIAITAIKLLAYEAGLIAMGMGLAIVFNFSYLMADMIVGTIFALNRERAIDAPTGLPNSLLLVKKMGQENPARLAVAQISNFGDLKAVCNDVELIEVIQSIAKRLGLLAAYSKVYRTGTDQLAWIVDEAYAARLHDHFETASAFFLSPVEAGGQRLQLNIHCGYAEGASENGIELLSKATIAAHNAAIHGYRWIPFSDDINNIAQEKFTILSDLDMAIENGDIWVAYQPKLEIQSAMVECAEALVRWEHPKLGKVSPAHFIPLLEAEGRMRELTFHIIRQCLTDLDRWNKMGKNLNCSVNISAALLLDLGFVEKCLGSGPIK